MGGERFIPFRKADIVSMCADELPSEERDAFRVFCAMLASLLHHEFHARIEALKDAYHPFNPQSDTRVVATVSTAERHAARQRLEEELAGLARAANFTEVDSQDLDRAFTEHSLLKVRLTAKLDMVDKIMIFRRGERVMTERVPIWFGLRRKTVEFPAYAKVLVYATIKEAEHFAGTDVDRLPFRPGSMIIKLFQNVPRHDLEMVLPNVEVRMRRIDKLLIGVPAVVSGIAVIATKLASSLVVLLLLIAVWLGIRQESGPIEPAELVTMGAGIFAFAGYVVRQVSKFQKRKIQFMKALSENLYFRNLDNDAGVFHHLLDAAEEAELIEAVLAYHFLRTAETSLTLTELDRRVEAWLNKRSDGRVDFEVHDGVGKLRRLGLVTEDEHERLGAVALAEAKRRMDTIWDGVFSYSSAPASQEPA